MLGSYITRTLLKDGYDVTASVYPGSNTDMINSLPIRITEGDITSDLPYAELLSDCDYIIHAAATTQIWPKRDTKIWKINHEATLKLAQAAKTLHIKRFVHIGTGSSFSPKHPEFMGNESIQDYDDQFGMDYMDSKAAVQHDLLQWHEREGFPVIIINPTYMLGPHDSGPTSGTLILNMMRGGMQGVATGGKNVVYSGDVARTAVNALTMGRTGQCYIARGENVSFSQLVSYVNKSLVVKSTNLIAPYPLTLGVSDLLSSVARIKTKLQSSASRWRASVRQRPILTQTKH